MPPVRVLILSNHHEGADDPEQATEPVTSPVTSDGRGEQARILKAALAVDGHQIHCIDIEDDIGRLQDALTVIKPHLVFSLIDYFCGDSTQYPAIVGLLELLAVPHAGSHAVCLSMCLDRVRARAALSYAGIPTPGFRVVRDGNAIPATDGLRAPMIVTQAFDDVYTDEGQTHPLTTHEHVVARCSALIPDYALPFLIEEYIVHRRVHAVVLGNRVLELLPLVELADAGDSWQLAQLEPDQLGRVRELARRSFRALDCRDLAQIDIHLDERGEPYVIDVRPMPHIGPDTPLWAAASYTERGCEQVLRDVLAHAWADRQDS